MKDETIFNVDSNNLMNNEDLEVEGGAPRPIGFVYVENEYIEELEKKAKAFDVVKRFVNENAIEDINDDLYDAGYVQACNDILKMIQENENDSEDKKWIAH